MAIEVAEVISSFLASASYDTEAQQLTVTTMGGRELTSDLDPDSWAEFQASPSKGRWFRRNVMGLDH